MRIDVYEATALRRRSGAMEPKGGTPQSPAAAKLPQRPKKLNRNHLSAISHYYDGYITRQSGKNKFDSTY